MVSVYDAIDLKAKPGAFSTFDMEFMEPYVEQLQPGQVYLEIGVDKGKSLSVARMVAKRDVTVIGVDLREDPEVPDTLFYRMDSRDLRTPVKVNRGIDILFIDGDHTYEGCGADIYNWYPFMQKRGIIFFHDCDASSPGVVQAAEEFAKKIGKELVTSPEQRCSMGKIEL